MRTLVLLRGINVGGRHVVPMAVLRSLFEAELQCTAVSTYIQSGNVVCTPPPKGLDARVVEGALAARFGFAVPAVLRTGPALEAAIASNPYLEEGRLIEHLHIVFRNTVWSEDVLGALERKRTEGERLAAHGRELFLHLPHGAGRSKLAAAVVAPALPGSPTMRNWKTVLALHEMLAW